MATITSPAAVAGPPAHTRLRSDDLGWNAPEEAFLLVATAGATSAGCERLRAVVPADFGNVVVARQAPNGFREFVSAASLLDELFAASGAEAEAVLGRYEEALRPLIGAGEQRSDSVDARRVGESVTFAVTRRVSRESHHYAGVIDAFGRVVAEIAALSPAGLAIVVPDLKRWDRPSIRALYRAALLISTSGRARGLVVAGAALPPGAQGDGYQPNDAARARVEFLGALADRPGVRTVARVETGGAALPGMWRLERDRWDRGEIVTEIGRALAYQNYERVYLLCQAGLPEAGDDAARADLRRLVAIAHAQRGAIEAAQRELALALELAGAPDLRAHLWYLRGLLHTKRDYDLDQASAAYAWGIAELEHADGDAPTTSLEQAWLCNGQALIEALQAKGAPHREAREAHLATAFELELRAFRLARGLASSAGSYLRHNLLANLTFLLEISGRYEEAISFWTRSFDRYLAADSPSFQAVFDYRLAVLLGRVGRYAEAQERLASVRAFCAARRDPFYEHSVCLALAFFAGHEGSWERAADLYRAAAELASRIRHEEGYCQAVGGLLLALAQAGNRRALREALAHLRDAGAPLAALVVEATKGELGDLAAFLHEHGVQAPAPAPKLSPYVPSIDLEGTPSRDMNRFLAGWTS